MLTAAHCLNDGYQDFTAVMGRTDITEDGGDEIPVLTGIVHDQFDYEGTWECDFALLFLTWPTTATTVQLTNLNTDESFPASGTIGTVIGWGDLNKDEEIYEGTDILMTIDTTVLSNEECAAAQGRYDGYTDNYSDLIYPSMICTMSDERKNACKGDSGESFL